MSRPLSIVGVQTSSLAWDPEATLEAFEVDLRAHRLSSPEAHFFVHPELHLTALGRRRPSSTSTASVGRG